MAIIGLPNNRSLQCKITIIYLGCEIDMLEISKFTFTFALTIILLQFFVIICIVLYYKKKSIAISIILTIVSILGSLIGTGYLYDDLAANQEFRKNSSTEFIVSPSPSLSPGNTQKKNNAPEENNDVIHDTIAPTAGATKIWLEDVTLLQHNNSNSVGGDYWIIDENAMDNINIIHKHGVILNTPNYGNDNKGQYVEYFLDKQFSEFNFIIALHKESRDMKFGFLINMYFDKDDDAKYSIAIKSGFIPVSQKLDVSSVEVLKIEVLSIGYGSTNGYYGADAIIIGDAYFTPN